jgi:probable dihydroxyacetone kinase regulator
MVKSIHIDSKSVLADSLMELAKNKPLEKITIQNIVDNCGAGRQTFYNHFNDKYDLMNWIYKTNAHRIWSAFIDLEPWSRVLSRIMDHMKENKIFYNRAINTNGQNSFFVYLFQDIQSSCIILIQKNLKKNALPDYILFTIDFYCYGAVNMVKQWAKNGMIESSELFAENIYHNMPEELKKLINYKVE